MTVGVCFSLALSQGVKKTVTGKVVDQGSQQGLEGVLIVLSTGVQDPVTGKITIPVSIDSAYTDVNGVFTKDITVDQNAYGITYKITRYGYQAKNGYSLFTTATTLDLGTISLTPWQIRKITVTGTVLDTSTGNPVPQALVTLKTSNIGIGKKDTVYADDKGNFKIEIDVTGNQITPILYYSVEKKGYLTKTGQAPILGLIVDLGKIFLTPGLNKTVVVSGTVLDTATGKPVSQALVTLKTSNMSVDPPDTVYTDNDGYFKKEVVIRISVITPTLYYSVEKKTYQTKTGQAPITGQTLDLGKIFLKPGTNKIVTVVGKVINADNQEPIKDAMVLLTTLAISLKPDTAYTDEKGNFKALVEVSVISPIEPMLYYAVSKTGFRPVTGQKQIAGDPVDLGTIQLSPLSVAVWFGKTAFSSTIQPTGLVVYSPNGRTIYSGAIKNLNRIANQSSKSAIVCYTANGKTIYRTKVTLGK